MLIYHWRYKNSNPHGPTGEEAAMLCGVSRRTIYRWVEEGRLAYPITYAALEELRPRKRGPKRNPASKRYTLGRHSFETSGSRGLPLGPKP